MRWFFLFLAISQANALEISNPFNDGSRITIGTVNGNRLGGGATSYIQNTDVLQSGSSFYVAHTSATVIEAGSATVRGPFAVEGSSITLPNQTTFYFNNPLTYIKSSSNTACTEFHFNFNSQDYALSSSATITTTASLFYDVTPTLIQDLGAKAILVHSHLEATQDGTGEANSINACSRPIGDTVACTGLRPRPQVACELANEKCFGDADQWINVISTGSLSHACRVGGVGLSAASCYWSLGGWCR